MSTGRVLWIIWCLWWAAFWFFWGFLTLVTFLFVPFCLLAILLPIGNAAPQFAPGLPPGWYADHRGVQRWWDGYRWTGHTAGGGDVGPCGAC